jgi:hypothetical protein
VDNIHIRIVEVPVSNHRTETGITIEVFDGIRQFFQASAGIILRINRGSYRSHSFQLIIRLLSIRYIGMRPVAQIDWGKSPLDASILMY